jgi:hypothetical protein
MVERPISPALEVLHLSGGCKNKGIGPKIKEGQEKQAFYLTGGRSVQMTEHIPCSKVLSNTEGKKPESALPIVSFTSFTAHGQLTIHNLPTLLFFFPTIQFAYGQTDQ